MIDYGFLISLLASIVALWGVYLFNQKKDYTGRGWYGLSPTLCLWRSLLAEYSDGMTAG